MTTRRILIVDENPEIVLLLGAALERSGHDFDISFAHSGVEAMDVFRNSSVDLLITPQWLADITGLELIKWAREHNPDTRSVFIATHSSNGTTAKAQSLGSHCIIKPFDAERFIKTVHEALSQYGGGQTLAGLQTRDLLISLMFHELRMPLTFIMGYAELLAEQSDETCCEWAQTIRCNTERINHVLDDLTLLTEWSTGMAMGQPQPTDLCRIVRASVSQLTSLAVEKQQILEFSPPANSVWLSTDPWLLGVVLNSLISGALKRTPTQGRVSVLVRDEGKVATVTVKGCHGFGSDSKGADAEPGMGLSLARRLAESMGGSLQVTPAAQEDEAILILTLPVSSQTDREDRSIPGTETGCGTTRPAWQTRDHEIGCIALALS